MRGCEVSGEVDRYEESETFAEICQQDISTAPSDLSVHRCPYQFLIRSVTRTDANREAETVEVNVIDVRILWRTEVSDHLNPFYLRR